MFHFLFICTRCNTFVLSCYFISIKIFIFIFIFCIYKLNQSNELNSKIRESCLSASCPLVLRPIKQMSYIKSLLYKATFIIDYHSHRLCFIFYFNTHRLLSTELLWHTNMCLESVWTFLYFIVLSRASHRILVCFKQQCDHEFVGSMRPWLVGICLIVSHAP